MKTVIWNFIGLLLKITQSNAPIYIWILNHTVVIMVNKLCDQNETMKKETIKMRK